MLTMLLLACKSDQGLQNKNDNPGQNLEPQACDCPDNTAELTELQEELNSLRDRVVTLEGAAGDPTTPSVVVTEYEVDCANQTVRLDVNDYYEVARPLTYTASGAFTRADHPWACVTARVDPSDPPWSITASYVEDLTLSRFRYSQALSEELVGFDYPEAFDLMSNFGNEWNYLNPGFGPDNVAVGNSRIHKNGWVVSGVPWQADCTSYTEYDGDCPLRADMAKLRVVILDDKPALRPEAW